MTVSRREFLGGMLAVIVLPKTLEGLDFPAPVDPADVDFSTKEWIAESWYSTGALEAALLSGGEEIPPRLPLSFSSARDGIIVNDVPLEWPTFDRTAYIDGLRIFDADGNWLFESEIQMNTHYVMAGDQVSFPVSSIAMTFG